MQPFRTMLVSTSWKQQKYVLSVFVVYTYVQIFEHAYVYVYIYIYECVWPILIQGVSVPAIQIEVVQEDMEMLGYEFVPWIAKRF